MENLDYPIEVHSFKCQPGKNRLYGRIVATEDIQQLLPYFNGYCKDDVVKKPRYCPKLNWIQFLFWGYPDKKDEPKEITINGSEILVSTFYDRKEAEVCCKEVLDFMNYIDYNKDNIVPSYKEWDPPKPLDIYKLLPKDNCRKCGFPTCMAFSMKLIEGKAFPEDCHYIMNNLDKLENIRERLG